jgi:hypothetical protein
MAWRRPTRVRTAPGQMQYSSRSRRYPPMPWHRGDAGRAHLRGRLGQRIPGHPPGSHTTPGPRGRSHRQPMSASEPAPQHDPSAWSPSVADRDMSTRVEPPSGAATDIRSVTADRAQTWMICDRRRLPKARTCMRSARLLCCAYRIGPLREHSRRLPSDTRYQYRELTRNLSSVISA